MRKLIFIVLAFLFSCQDCDSDRYQVHAKTDIGNGTCHYEVWALTTCATWQRRETISFNEVCTKFQMSQVLTKSDVAPYR